MSKAALGAWLSNGPKVAGQFRVLGVFLGGGLVDPIQEFLVQRAEGRVNTF